MNKQKKDKEIKRKDNDLLKTMIATAIAGVIIIILMIVIIMQVVGGNKSDNKAEKNEHNVTLPEENKVEETIEKQMSKVTGVIKNINKEDLVVSIIEVDTDALIDMVLDNTTEIVDEYGKPMTFSELTMGDMVYTKYNKLNGKPELFRLSSESWEYTVDEIKVDPLNKTVQRGNESYFYTDELISLYNGQQLDITEITKEDEVIIRGYKDKLCVIEMIKSHGFIKLKDYEYFLDGIMTIDRDKTFIVEEVMDNITVSEGKHRVVIEMEGYESFVQDIIVIPNETVIIDLSEFQIKRGQVEFKTENKDIKVYVNDTIIQNIDQPLFLDYGEHTLKVMSEGKVILEDKLIVDTPYMLYNITVQQDEPKRGIHINTDPLGAEIYINNQFYGYSPITVNLESGNYKVLIIKDGYHTGEYDIYVSEGKEDLFFAFPALKETNNVNEEPSNNDDSNDNNDDSITTPIDDVYGQ